MLTIQLTAKPYWENNVEAYVILVDHHYDKNEAITTIEKEFYPHLSSILKRHKFTGKRGESYALTARRGDGLVHFLFYGLGQFDKKWDRELELFRRTMGSIVLQLKKLEITDAVISVPSAERFGIQKAELIKQMTIASIMVDYEFETFKTLDKKSPWNGVLYISDVSAEQKDIQDAFKAALVIGQATNSTRHLADLPGNIMTPSYLAEHAQQLAKKHGLKYTVFGREKALELGMGGFCAVDVGSDQDGKFIILEYAASSKNAPTVALVGKGITFDTGGISLKPSASMKGMKYDMSGAAAVIETLGILAQLKPHVNVIGIAPTVENMPSGKASRQDDIITFMNGRTAEINSTDAEGRLILADALCYAEKFYNPDVIIDIATLTGAASYVFGHFYSCLLTHDDALAEQLMKWGQVTGDKVGRLMFDEDFKKAIATPVADISNTGSSKYGAGTTTAAWFLNHFVNKARWAHLDIAGTAHDVPGINYIGEGASGAGVRLMTEFVLRFQT